MSDSFAANLNINNTNGSDGSGGSSNHDQTNEQQRFTRSARRRIAHHSIANEVVVSNGVDSSSNEEFGCAAKRVNRREPSTSYCTSSNHSGYTPGSQTYCGLSDADVIHLRSLGFDRSLPTTTLMINAPRRASKRQVTFPLQARVSVSFCFWDFK